MPPRGSSVTTDRHASARRRGSLLSWGLALCLAGMTGGPALAQIVKELPSELKSVDVLEHAGERLPLDLQFRDHRGNPMTLGSLFRSDRPVILSLNYSNCPMLCNLQLTGLVESLNNIEWSAGKEFDVVSISIDPLETPERAAETQQRYFQMYGRPGTADGWHFLIGKQSSIEGIARAVGFQYQYVRERREYSHPAVFVLCTPDGRISRYVYGVQFPSQTMKLSLVEASEGTIGSAWERVLLYCLHYDDKTGQYTPAVWKLMRLGGIVTLMIVGGWIGLALRRERRELIARRESTGVGSPIPREHSLSV